MKTAAARSPNSRVRADASVADIPAASSAGTVPSPKAAIVTNPPAGLSLLAAATSMAHVRPQGSNPARMPSPILEPGLLEFASLASLLPKTDA